MYMDADQKYREALKRLIVLESAFGLDPRLIKCFQQGRLFYSSRDSGWGHGYIEPIINNEVNYAVATIYEVITGRYVYHVIETRKAKPDITDRRPNGITDENNGFQTVLTLLYVSSDKEAWAEERLDNGRIRAFSYNVDEGEGKTKSVLLTSDHGSLLVKDERR